MFLNHLQMIQWSFKRLYLFQKYSVEMRSSKGLLIWMFHCCVPYWIEISLLLRIWNQSLQNLNIFCLLGFRAMLIKCCLPYLIHLHSKFIIFYNNKKLTCAFLFFSSTCCNGGINLHSQTFLKSFLMLSWGKNLSMIYFCILEKKS